MPMQFIKQAANANAPRLPAAVELMHAFSDAGLAFVPAVPHAGMVAAGADAGSVGEAGSRTEVLALDAPPARGDSQKIEDDGTGAEKILAFLVERKLV